MLKGGKINVKVALLRQITKIVWLQFALKICTGVVGVVRKMRGMETVKF
jgi:hypothetical protein